MAHSLTGMAQDHDFTATFTAEYDNDQTNNTIITPTTGKSLAITSVNVSTEGATSAGQEMYFKFATSANTVAEFHPTTTPYFQSTGDILIRGAQNEPLNIKTTLGAGKNYFVSVNYREEQTYPQEDPCNLGPFVLSLGHEKGSNTH